MTKMVSISFIRSGLYLPVFFCTDVVKKILLHNACIRAVGGGIKGILIVFLQHFQNPYIPGKGIETVESEQHDAGGYFVSDTG